MTKTITVVCDTDEGVIYGSIEEARDAYFSEIDEVNDESHEYACERLERDFCFENLVNAIVTYDIKILDAVRSDYYNYVSDYNEDSFSDWLDSCIVSDIEVEV